VNDRIGIEPEIGIAALIKDGQPHRTDSIVKAVYGEGIICEHCGRGDNKALARVGARVWDVKKRYGVKIDGCKDKRNPKLYCYQMELEPPIPDFIPRLYHSKTNVMPPISPAPVPNVEPVSESCPSGKASRLRLSWRERTHAG
jgi:hypothetical protein